MIASRLLTSSVTALAIVGAVGWAYAQTTPAPAPAPAAEAQTPMTAPADTTAVTPAPDAAAPGAAMSEPVARADRN